MDLYQFTIVLGIITYIFMFITFLIGLRVIKWGFKKHKYFAIATLLGATIHASLFIFMNYF